MTKYPLKHEIGLHSILYQTSEKCQCEKASGGTICHNCTEVVEWNLNILTCLVNTESNS